MTKLEKAKVCEELRKAALICFAKQTQYNWASENADRYRIQNEAFRMCYDSIMAYSRALQAAKRGECVLYTCNHQPQH